MKKIIDGKSYNTDTATRIGHWWNGLSRSDFGYCEEELYLTKKDAWFIAGEGGAMSRWSESCSGGGLCGGSGIRPLTATEAREWCENHDIDAEVIEEHFVVDEA